MFAATGSLAWNETAYAARHSAEHVEEGVAAVGPAVRCVDLLLSLALGTCYAAGVARSNDTFICVTGQDPRPLQLRIYPVFQSAI